MAKGTATKREKERTAVLSPLAAVEMVWAATGAPSQDKESDTKTKAVKVRNELNTILERYEKDDIKPGNAAMECEYLRGAKASIESAIRSLDIIYKGRELNFEEISKLRDVQMEYIKDTLHFGTRAKDFLHSLPSIVIGSAGGLTLGEYLAKKFADGSPILMLLLTLAAGGLGYLIYIIAIAINRTAKRRLMIAEDYNRNLYYEQYLNRCYYVLLDLYLDLETVHERVFGNKYFPKEEGAEFVKRNLQGAQPTFCEYVHKHYSEKKITPKLWAICETGNENNEKDCPKWEVTKKEKSK